MTPAQYERMWLLFEEAQSRRPQQRRAFLDEQCAADPLLRAEVEKLLAQAERRTTALLDAHCPVNLKMQLGDADADSLLGRRVGPYEVQRQIAVGGMGVVYLAARKEDFQQHVAIKWIKAGFGSADILRRFHSERQLLARLNHPHIARPLDAGTLDGRPYFVMEYIDGLPIDRFCQERQLSVAARLRLCLSVCSAVHYAHQNFVLHRDLKPGNILVENSGVVKLVDFGIAKLLNPAAAEGESAPTQTGSHFGTPEYTSPEQIRGDKHLGIACDVYALGVVLYELLTGKKPFELGNLSIFEFTRRVCEEEPPPLRRVRPDLPRDLEVIVLKCLRKQPEQRFASVAEVADELERFLAGEPIRSRPVSRAERTVKWIRRRPAIAALAAITTVALFTSLGLILWDNHRQNESRRKAEAGERIVADLMGDLIGILGDDGRNAPPDVSVRQLAILDRRVARSLEEHRTEIDSIPRLAQYYGELLEKIGEQYYLLAHDREAKEVYQKALGLQRRLVAQFPNEPEYQYDLAATLHALSLPLRRERAFEESAQRNQEALQLFRGLCRGNSENAKYQEGLARHLHHMADLQKDQWVSPAPSRIEFTEVSALYSEGRDVLQKLIARFPEERRYQLQLAANYHSWGHALTLAGAAHLDAARTNYELAAARFDRLIEQDPTTPDYRHEQARLLASKSSLCEKQGDRDAARTCCRQAVAIETPLMEQFPTVAKYRFELARQLTRLGDLLWPVERDEAEKAYRQALVQRRRLLQDSPWRASDHGDLGLLLTRIAERTPPADPATAHELQQEAMAELTKAIELGAKTPVYSETHARLQKKSER
jgi:serine/threonine protein kinase/tetratricopeptide (TPR) repeat protein